MNFIVQRTNNIANEESDFKKGATNIIIAISQMNTFKKKIHVKQLNKNLIKYEGIKENINSLSTIQFGEEMFKIII